MVFLVLFISFLGSTQFIAETGEVNVVFIDPIGAIIIGIYILITWWQTGLGKLKITWER
jgi:divalent metal cation (Fe/Co/Zn/Cd) transporter